MGWRRLGERVVMVATAAAVISMVAFAVVAFVDRGGGGVRPFDHGGAVAPFSACISQARFLVLVRHGSGNKVIEMIKDRARDVVVGEFALLPSVRAAQAFPTPLAGFGAENGRYVVFTTDPVGRDAGAIEDCWGRFFPIAPNA